MKAVETHYAGCRFRSRLEARWAVLFDELGIDWQYEPQGYHVGARLGLTPKPYLPDFHLPNERLWVEIKGDVHTVDVAYLASAAMDLVDDQSDDRNRASILLLGSVPYYAPTKWGNVRPLHTALRHHKGDVHVEHAWFTKGSVVLEDNEMAWQDRWIACDEQGLLDSPWAKPQWLFGTLPLPEAGIPAANRAYSKARMARFEHGERG